MLGWAESWQVEWRVRGSGGSEGGRIGNPSFRPCTQLAKGGKEKHLVVFCHIGPALSEVSLQLSRWAHIPGVYSGEHPALAEEVGGRGAGKRLCH